MLDTNASDHGTSAALSQFQDGVERPIAFASRTLSKSERNYCVTHRELLAITEFVEQHWHYLQGTRFCIRTDHVHLRFVVRAKDPMHTFDFEIHYQPGQRHLNANALSGRPCDARCKWCRGWKSQERASHVDVGVQTVMHVPCQHKQPVNCEEPVGARCATVKLEPTWTSLFLREQQEADFDLLEGSQHRKTIVGRCVASELCCGDLVVTVGAAALQKQCALSQMGK